MGNEIVVRVQYELVGLPDERYEVGDCWIDIWKVYFTDLSEAKMSRFLELGYSPAYPIEWNQESVSENIRCADLDTSLMLDIPF